MLYTDYISTRL